jgi:methyl-accepting chemotaxis protein
MFMFSLVCAGVSLAMSICVIVWEQRTARKLKQAREGADKLYAEVNHWRFIAKQNDDHAKMFKDELKLATKQVNGDITKLQRELKESEAGRKQLSALVAETSKSNDELRAEIASLSVELAKAINAAEQGQIALEKTLADLVKANKAANQLQVSFERARKSELELQGKLERLVSSARTFNDSFAMIENVPF